MEASKKFAMSKLVFCVNCFKLIRKEDMKWLKKQVISEEGYIMKEWYQGVCKRCYDKLKDRIRKDLIFYEEIYIKEEF